MSVGRLAGLVTAFALGCRTPPLQVDEIECRNELTKEQRAAIARTPDADWLSAVPRTSPAMCVIALTAYLIVRPKLDLVAVVPLSVTEPAGSLNRDIGTDSLLIVYRADAKVMPGATP